MLGGLSQRKLFRMFDLKESDVGEGNHLCRGWSSRSRIRRGIATAVERWKQRNRKKKNACRQPFACQKKIPSSAIHVGNRWPAKGVHFLPPTPPSKPWELRSATELRVPHPSRRLRRVGTTNLNATCLSGSKIRRLKAVVCREDSDFLPAVLHTVTAAFYKESRVRFCVHSLTRT